MPFCFSASQLLPAAFKLLFRSRDLAAGQPKEVISGLADLDQS
ncbi:MAG: hypothetical protein ACYDEF_06260 [Methanosarcina sp.]